MMKLKNKDLAIMIAIVLSGIILITLSVTISRLSKESTNANSVDNENNKITKEKDDEETIYIGTNELGKKYTYNANKVAEKLKNYDFNNNGKKIVFLTFDDGTSTTNTPEILRILDENNIKATFFLVGYNIDTGGERAKELVKEEFDKGHAIGNHSYSHNMKGLFPGGSLDLDAFKEDYEKNEELLKDILGDNFSTRLIRCPGGYMTWDNMEPLDEYLDDNDMVSIDWNAIDADAQGAKKNAEELLNYTIETSKGKEIVVLLMHDTYGKEETVKALPQIIKYFKDNGYEFRTLS